MSWPAPVVWLRAKTLNLSCDTAAGVVAQAPAFFLSSPVAHAKTGGNADLTVSSGGLWSSAAGIGNGSTESATATATGADGVVIPYTINLTGISTGPTTPAKRFAFTGDSTTNNSGGGNGGASGYNNSRLVAPNARVATLLNADGYATNIQSFYGTGGNNTLSTYAASDPAHITVGTATALANLPANNLIALAAGQTFGPYTFDDVDTIVMRFPTAGYGQLSYSIDGGAPVTVNEGGANSLQVVTVSGLSRGSHTVTFANVSGTAYVWGVEGKITRNEIALINMGTRGAKIADLINNTSSRPWYHYSTTTALALDGAALNIGINDVGGGTAMATFDTGVRTWVNRQIALNPAFKLVVELPNPINVPAPTGITEAQMRAVLTQVAADYSAPLVDRWASMGVTNYAAMGYASAWAYANALGLMYDDLHPNPAGYALIAPPLKAAVKTALALP